MADESSTSTSIDVDDAAAYFGVTESSDILHSMMAMSRDEAMTKFFDFLSDIVLQPGDFNFEAASERMACEGGEIYYLVAGHLGLMSMPDPILGALGQPTSLGEVAETHSVPLSAEQSTALQQLADPMRMMRIFAVAHVTGGATEVLRYLRNLESLMSDVGANASELTSVNGELSASMDVSGHVLPIPSLASGEAVAATVESLPTPAAQTAPEPPTPALPSIVEAPSATPAVVEASIPLPRTDAGQVSPPHVHSPPPAATPSVALPNVPEAIEAVEAINIENEKQVQRAAQNAFAGAFDISMGQDDAHPEASINEPVEIPDADEEFVSAAEHFIAADGDGSGELSVEELAQATATSIEEATALHAEADVDGDGSVTLSEFMASSAAAKTDGLPRPVAPVRKPLSGAARPVTPPTQTANSATPGQPPVNPAVPQPTVPPQQGWQQQPAQGWQQPPPQTQQPQQGWQQPPSPQGWPQPQPPMVQPTIRSGVHCRGCGIGLDPYWRFCPICGQQNLGY